MNASSLRCRAVLFDMDGTLVDSIAVVERVWADWAGRRGVDLASILAVCHGRPTIDTLRMVAPHLATAAEAASIDAAEAVDTRGLRPVKGAPELLASLHAARWAVVTSADPPLARARLGAVGLPIPDVLVTPADVAAGKPDPAPYLHAAERLGTAPGECVVVEDTPVGIQSGRGAGAIVIGLTTTFPELQDCDYCVPDLSVISAKVESGWIALELSGARLRVADPEVRIKNLEP